MILRHQHLNALVASIMCHNDMGPSKSFFSVATEQSWMMENQGLESAQEMVVHDT